LQLRGVFGRDAGAGEFAEPGVDAIDGRIATGSSGDHRGSGVDPAAAVGIDAHRQRFAEYPAQFNERCFARNQCKFVSHDCVL
jgi:hypothetical protein